MRKFPRKIGAGRLRSLFFLESFCNKILGSCGINVLQLFYGFCFVFLFLAAHFLWHKKNDTEKYRSRLLSKSFKGSFCRKSEAFIKPALPRDFQKLADFPPSFDSALGLPF